MTKKIEGTLVTREEIQKICERLGAEITRDYQGKEVLLVGVLRGAFIFMADLIRQIDLPCRVDFLAVSSYGSDTNNSGVVKIIKDIDQSISGKHVIIVEDIVDTGLTLKKLTEMLATRNPASMAVCTAFDKPKRRIVDIDVKYCGKEIPDEFIVGYGIDYAEQYRNLPDVCFVRDEENGHE